MFLPIDPSSGLPIYRQIMEQVRRMIAARALAAGDRLPSVREISATLRINPLTVAKAYQELEQAGLVEMRRGLGVFVVERPSPPPGGARTREVEATAERLVLEAVQAGLGKRELDRKVAEAWERVHSNARGGQNK